VAELLPGDVGLVSINGTVGKLIRLGQWLNGDGFSNYEHAFIYIGNGEIVEAQPGGAIRTNLSKYDGREILWSSGLIDLTAQQRVTIVTLATNQIGTPYSFLDYFAIFTKRLHLPLPWISARVLNSKHLICSQLCAEDYDLAGSKLSNKPAYLTSPGAIRDYLLSLKK
jgi:cell wall-associated NlpC family hydrolase